MERPLNYELPVSRLLATREVESNGQRGLVRGVYLYWYVADGAMSGSALGLERMWWMARELLRTGVLQRWAYISCTAVCAPGQEEATTERMKQFITAAVPEFQLTPKPPAVTAVQASPAEAKKLP